MAVRGVSCKQPGYIRWESTAIINWPVLPPRMSPVSCKGQTFVWAFAIILAVFRGVTGDFLQCLKTPSVFCIMAIMMLVVACLVLCL